VCSYVKQKAAYAVEPLLEFSRVRFRSQVCRASARPGSPVPALALPVLITNARMSCSLRKCCSQTCTGAARNRLVVNTPATALLGASLKTVMSRFPSLRLPDDEILLSSTFTGFMFFFHGI